MILSHSLTWIHERVVELVFVVSIPSARRLSIYLLTDGDQLMAQLITITAAKMRSQETD
jgi:hypothetical protein